MTNVIPTSPGRHEAHAIFVALSRAKSTVMFGICVVFTLIIITLLALVTGYLTHIGFKSLHWSFFTEMPIPPGMQGRRGE